ncbi:MAG: hypothetical protein HQL23_07370 [Candidatus Omnitrophica bacterium]|nr:hypothetical protein [Candidatus Omnitrophota bacterium]
MRFDSAENEPLPRPQAKHFSSLRITTPGGYYVQIDSPDIELWERVLAGVRSL